MDNQTKKKLHLGLDLGIASVGWSLVDEQQNIIKCGSHLFKQLSVDINNTSEYGEKVRGELRRARRRLNRFKQRKIDFLCMIDEFCLPNQEKKNITNKLSTLHKKEYQNIFGFNQSNTSTDFLFNNASNQNYKSIDLYKVYKKGFNEKLDPKELFLFLYWKLGMRGVFFKEFSDANKVDYCYEDSVCFKYYEPILKSNFGKIRSSKSYDAKISHSHHRKDIEVILNKQNEYYKDSCPSFTNFINDYLKIFDRHRDEHGPWYDDYYDNHKYKEKAQELFSKLSEKQRKWIIDRDENGKPKYNYLWEKNIGECPISKINNDKTDGKIDKRLSQYFFIAEISNLISQLANTKLHNQKLTIGQIKEIFKNIIKNSESLSIKNIAKYLKYDVNDFTSYPKNKTRASCNFEKLKKFLAIFNKKNGYIQNIKSLYDLNLIKIINDFDELEHIRFELLKEYFIKVDDQKDKDKKSAKSESDINLKNKNKNFIKSKEDAHEKISKSIFESKLSFIKIENINFDNFCNFENINDRDMSGTREYGYSAFYNYINNVINNSDNQEIDCFNVWYKDEIEKSKIQTFEKFCKVNKNKTSQKENLSNQFIPNKLFNNLEFISPNVKNTIRETIRVINNEVLKFCYKNNKYELDAIILETTYGDNEINSSLLSKKQKKEEISKLQEFQEKYNQDAKTELEKHGLPPNELNIKKYNLWKEQDHCDAYGINSRIEISEFNECEVDHIIPRSISHDNTKANLVLTRRCNNQSKGKQTPVQWLANNPVKLELLKEQWNIWFLHSDNNKNKVEEYHTEKYKNLTCEDLEYSNFFRRNLSETTYAIRKIKEGLSTFLKIRNNQVENKQIKSEFIINNLRKIINCQIMTISGSQSQYIRRLIDENWTKDRNISNHHAHDASIIAIYSSLNYIKEYNNKMSNLWKIEKSFDDKNTFNHWIQNLSFNRSNELKKFINENKDEIKRKILDDANFSYSCKPKKNRKTINWINRLLENGEQEKAIQLIKKIPTSQIFKNANYETYRIIDNKKHQITKIDLTNKLSDKKFVEIYNSIKEEVDKLSNCTDDDVEKIVKEYCVKNYIITNYKIINDLFLIIEKGNSTEKKDETNNQKNENNNKENKIKNNFLLFAKYLEEISQVIDINNIDGIPVIDDDSETLKIKYCVKFIRQVDKNEYKPTYEFNRDYKFTKSKIGKTIFNNKHFCNLNNKKCLFGHKTKFYALIELNKKMKFVKINQLNFIIGKNINDDLEKLQSNIKLLKIFNKNQSFKLNNQIYEINNYDISNCNVSITNNSTRKNNKSIVIKKSYNSLDKELKDKLEMI